MKVREEFCKPVNMEKNKRKFGLLLTEAMIELLRSEDCWIDPKEHRKLTVEH